MRLTRKLYSEPDEEDENDEKTWKRRRNVGIVGAGAGATIHGLGRSVLNSKSKHSEHVIEALEKAKNKVAKESDDTLIAAGKNAQRLKTGGIVLGIAGTGLAVGSEIKRRKLKKNDENKA